MGKTIAIAVGLVFLLQFGAPARADDPNAPGQAQRENQVADCLNEASNTLASGGSSDDAFDRCTQEHGQNSTAPASSPFGTCDQDCR
jgi:hypothetical protein